MNDKQRYFNEIALETIKDMTTDVEKWMAFLKTMSYNYTFTYPEQIMIFAQKNYKNSLTFYSSSIFSFSIIIYQPKTTIFTES